MLGGGERRILPTEPADRARPAGGCAERRGGQKKPAVAVASLWGSFLKTTLGGNAAGYKIDALRQTHDVNSFASSRQPINRDDAKIAKKYAKKMDARMGLHWRRGAYGANDRSCRRARGG